MRRGPWMGGPRPPRPYENLGLWRMQQGGVGKRIPLQACLLKASAVCPCHGSGRCWVRAFLFQQGKAGTGW